MGKLSVVSSRKAEMTSQVQLPTWISKANDQQGREIMLRIAPRVYISKTTLIECIQLINDVMPAILPGDRYTLQDLVGDEYWLARTVYQRIILGITWCWLVAEGYTPFKFGDFTCRTPKRYMRP
jgi:hypothetical protein